MKHTSRLQGCAQRPGPSKVWRPSTRTVEHAVPEAIDNGGVHVGLLAVR